MPRPQDAADQLRRQQGDAPRLSYMSDARTGMAGAAARTDRARM